MEKEKSNNQNKISNQGYVIVPNYFFREWIKVLGGGPALLYLELLSYCHQEKNLAWPTLESLSKKMQLTPKTITKYQQILVKFDLIKKINKRKTASGNYRRNIYRITPLDMEKNTLPLGKIFPYLEEKFTPNLGKNLPINNNNLKHYPYNNKDAVAVVVDFKKLEKAPPAKAGEKEEERIQMLREQLTDLDFKESFIEKILKVYSIKKIEEKLDLLMEGKNIQNPAGWLMAALKYDYQNSEQEEREEDEKREKISPKKINQKKEASSREKALEMIKKTKEMLANLQKKEEMCNGTKRINCQS